MEKENNKLVFEKAKQIYAIRRNAKAVRKFLSEENIPVPRQDRILEILEDEVGPEEVVKPDWQIALGGIIVVFAIIRLLFRIMN